MKITVKFVDLVAQLIRWKKFIILNFFVVCLITAAISLVIPKWYYSRAIILPPTEDSGFSFGAILSDLPLSGLGLGAGLDQGTSTIIALVNSRSLREKLIDRFDLITQLKVENVEEALEILESRISTEITEEGMIHIGVMTKTKFFANKENELLTRTRALEMVSFIVEQVDKANRALKTEQASRNRTFVEKRYFQNINDLKSAEDSLQVFQQKYGVLVLPEQLQASITAMADIKAQIAMQEMELEYKKSYLDLTHPEIVHTQNRLKAMRAEYEKMIRGGQNPDRVIIPLEKAPDLGITFARLYREVKLQETIMEFLLPQYEQAKIQEAKDTSTIQVLDAPYLPIKKAKPKRALLVLFAGFASLMLSIAAAYIYIHLAALEENNPADYNKIKEIARQLNPRYFLNRNA